MKILALGANDQFRLRFFIRFENLPVQNVQFWIQSCPYYYVQAPSLIRIQEPASGLQQIIYLLCMYVCTEVTTQEPVNLSTYERHH
jgi:hypothetical protein